MIDDERRFLGALRRDAALAVCAAVLGWTLGLPGLLAAVGALMLVYGLSGWRQSR